MQYQPEVDLASGAITGMEATGSGWEVLAAAAAELSTWRALPHPAMHAPRQMWVTATASQLLEVDVVERIGALIAEHALDRDCLGLQIGEDILATGGRFAPMLLADLREAGVALSIAGVGSWYAAMAAMGDLPVEAVKLDRAFVRGAGADLAQDGIVPAVVDLAHRHNLRVVADAVESWSEGARLCELGCDRAVGYLFSGPQDAGDARLMLTHGAGWCAPAQRVSIETHRNSAA
jgi:EAL domain-containing protein (putative c-di-GMP-specific phosphodiesterase class I)